MDIEKIKQYCYKDVGGIRLNRVTLKVQSSDLQKEIDMKHVEHLNQTAEIALVMNLLHVAQSAINVAIG